MTERTPSRTIRIDDIERPRDMRPQVVARPLRSGRKELPSSSSKPKQGQEDREAYKAGIASSAVSRNDQALIDIARREHATYDRRVARLGQDLACDTAWNMLVDLLISEDTGQALSVMAVSIGSRAAPATAIRYISLLEAEGVVERVRDHSDRRRTFVRLTPSGRAIVIEVLRLR